MKLIGIVKPGKRLGYNTANLIIEKPFDLSDGVYLATAFLDGKEYKALAVKGIIADLEVHLLDFKTRDLYEEKLKVEVLNKIRSLTKYKNEPELLKQIEEDKKTAREYFMRLN